MALGAARWVHVAPLARGDFPTETLARTRRGRRRSHSTARGSSGPPEPGRSMLDARLRPGLLRSVSILKLAEEEAELLVDGYDERTLAPARRSGGGRHARLPRVRCLRRRHRRARASAAGRERRSDRRRRRVRRRLPRRPQPRRRSHGRGANRLGARRRPALGPGGMIAHVQTAAGLAVVDLDEEIGDRARRRPEPLEPPPAPALSLPRVSRPPPKARRSSPSSIRSRRSSSRTTAAARGASRAAAFRPGARSRSRPTIPTSSSTPPETASICPWTAAASGGASRSSCPRSRRSAL